MQTMGGSIMEKLQWCSTCSKNKEKEYFIDEYKTCISCRDKARIKLNKTKEARVKYAHEYYLKNREKLLGRSKAWSETHKKPSQPKRPRTRKPVPAEKLCPHCGIVKSINDFRPRTGGYFAWICNPCEIKYRSDRAKANPDKERERQKRWVSANRELVNRRNRERYAKNPQKSLESSKKWQKANPEMIKISHARYYQKHKKEILRKQKEKRQSLKDNIKTTL